MYDITKQPKWVQEEIDGLQRRVEYLKAELAKRKGDEPSRVVVNEYQDVPYYLSQHDRITFHLDDQDNEKRVTVRMAVREGARVIEVLGHCHRYRNALTVIPSSGNCVHIGYGYFGWRGEE